MTMTDAYIKRNYLLLDGGTAIQCHRCKQVSHNIDDVRQLYCGNCNQFHEDQLPIPPQFKAIAEGIAMEARATICQGMEVEPEIFVLRVADKTIRQPEMRMGEPAERELMAQETRLLADEMNADVVILLSEAWTTPPGLSDAERAQYGSIGDIPGRQEILLLSVETADHYWQGKAPITGKGLDRRCGEVQYELANDETGRFTHFLYTPAEQAKLEATLALVRVMLGDLGVDPDTLVEHDGAKRRLVDIMRRVLVRNHHCESDPVKLGMAAAFLAQLAEP